MNKRSLAGIFLISSATLCLELCLLRYFSVSQHYHFAFLVISISFLGYGASGSFLSILKNIHSLDENKFLSYNSFLFSISIFFTFLISNSIHFDFIQLSWNQNQIFLIFLYYILFSIPFFFSGMIISFAIRKSAQEVNKIYFSDLFGAGTGTLLVIVVFLIKGDKGSILIISLMPLLASLLFIGKASYFWKSFISLFMIAGVFLFLLAPSWLSFRISPFKSLQVALKYPDAKHLLTEWNSISRIDIFESPAVRYAPGLSLLYQEKLPPQLGLSIDGGSITAITKYRDSQHSSLRFLDFLPASLAYSCHQNPNTLIINPKGGLDILSALYFKSHKIKVIEHNPLIVKLLKNEFSNFWGNLYEKQNVQLAVSYPRAAIKKEKEKYDLIVFSLPDVFGASSATQFGLGENYLFTVDSFEHILQILSDDGIISMTLFMLPPPRSEIKMLATWIEAMEKSGMNPVNNLVCIRTWGTISFFIKKIPFTENEKQKIKNFSEKCLFDIVYYPGINKNETNIYNEFEEPIYYNLTQKLLSPTKRKRLYDNYLFQINPATDLKPFFYNFLKINKFKSTYKALGNKLYPLLKGKFLVYVLLVQAIFISIVLIILPLFIIRKKKPDKKCSLSRIMGYFGILGLSFIFVEITFIQKFILFLGHPVYSTSIIVFSLLFSSGIGSFFSKKILGKNIIKNLKMCLILCVCFILISLFIFPLLFEHFIELDLLLKIIITFALIFPLGFVMGFPFPTGIRILEYQDKDYIPWAWAINAFSTVINSITALLFAFWIGYDFVLTLAGTGYLLSIFLLNFNRKNKNVFLNWKTAS
ncbi:MAG: hypothetical protein ACOC5F_04975 [Candidatus Aminicenantaceae bacterium]